MIHNNWWPWLQTEWKEPYFVNLSHFIHEAYETKDIYPPKAQVFSAFESCDIEDIRVVILGQDPYHQKGQAHGMCFSVNPGVKVPPSLINIYKGTKNFGNGRFMRKVFESAQLNQSLRLITKYKNVINAIPVEELKLLKAEDFEDVDPYNVLEGTITNEDLRKQIL